MCYLPVGLPKLHKNHIFPYGFQNFIRVVQITLGLRKLQKGFIDFSRTFKHVIKLVCLSVGLQNAITIVQLPVGLTSKMSLRPSIFYQRLKTSVAPFICLQNFQIFSTVIKSLVDQLFSQTFETFNKILHLTVELPNRQLQQDRLVGNRTSETSAESASLKQDFKNSSRV